MLWLLATDRDAGVGVGIGIHGWHSPPCVGRLDVHVLRAATDEGTGSALLVRLRSWLREHGCTEATATSR